MKRREQRERGREEEGAESGKERREEGSDYREGVKRGRE
jgi:hypothetical protein